MPERIKKLFNIACMNILALHSSSGLYGSSKVFLESIKTFVQEGYTVTAVVSEEGPLCNEIRKTNTSVHIIRLGVIRRKYFNPIGVINRLYYSIKAFYSLKKIIQEKNIDLVYSNTTAVLTGALAAKATGKKHIWHVHEIIEGPSILVRLISWMMNHYCTSLIAVSQAVINHWKKNKVITKFELVYNGFDYTQFHPSLSTLKEELKIKDDTIIIGTIGRINNIKGQDYFLQIAGKLMATNHQLAFIIVGDALPGNEKLLDELKRIASKENITKDVFFTGFRNDINNVLNAFDIFILPSILPDSLPTVVLEAMAAGKPVAATKKAGAMEMVMENETGLFIPLHNVVEAAKRIEILISNKELQLQMGTAGKIRVHEYFSLALFQQNIIKAIQ